MSEADDGCDDEAQIQDDDSVWQGYVDNESFGTTTLGLAFRVAELVGDLKRQEQSRECVVGLNDAFDALRKASMALSKRQVAADSMKNELERVAELFPELVGKSSDLQSQLDQWLRETPTDEDLAI